MGSHSRPFKDKNVGALDRKRERERQQMLKTLYHNIDEITTKLVQRLLDKHIIETNSDSAIRELVRNELEKLSSMEEFDIQYKIAPLRQLVMDANFITLYLTRYITEDLINSDKIMDIFGDDLEIYQVVDSVMSALRAE